MKNKKAIIILIVLILFALIIPGVSASDVNTTEEISASDTEDVTGTINVDSGENDYVNDGESAVDDSEMLSSLYDENLTVQNDVDCSEKNVLNNSDDENISSNENDFIVERDSNKVIKNSDDLLGLTSPDINENILNMAEEGQYSQIKYTIKNDLSILITLEEIQKQAWGEYDYVYSWSVVSKPANAYRDLRLISDADGYDVKLYDGLLNEGVSDAFTIVSGRVLSYTFYLKVWSNDGTYLSSEYYLPQVVNSEVDTVVSVNNPSVKYNSGEFNVSGKVTAGDTNVDAGNVNVKIGSVEKTATFNSDGTWTASGFSSTAYGITSTQSISVSYGGVSGSYKASTGTGNLTVSENTPTAVTINTVSPTYNSGTYTVSGTVSVTGNTNIATTSGLVLTVGSKTYTVNVGSDGKWSVTNVDSTLLTPDSRSISAKYVGNTYYNEKTQSASITVNKNTPTITVNDIATVTYNGESYTISGTARASGSNSELNSGTITLKTNTGEILSGTTSWSSGTWYVAGISSTLLAPGTYTVTATYSSTDYYNSASSTSKSLTVNKMTPTVIVTGNPNFKYNINQGQLINGRISNSINDEYGGYVNITIDGVLVKSNVVVNSDGTWSFTNYDTGRFIPSQNPYIISVSYSGNGFNYAGTGTGTYAVSIGDSIPIVVSGGDINMGDNKTVKVTVRDSKGFVKDSSVVLKGTGLPDTGLSLKTDSEGNAVFSVSDLTTGYYDDWMVIVEEDERYIPLFNQTVEPFYVKNALNIIITSVDSYHSTYPDSIVIIGKTDVNDNPVGSVNMTLGDKTVNVPLNNGVFKATFSGVIPGKYSTVNAVFIPDGSEHRYGGHVQDVKLDNDIIIDKFSPVIEIMDVQLTKDLYPGVVSISFRLIGAENGRLPAGRVDAIFDGRVGKEVFVNSDDVYTIAVGNLPEGTFSMTLRYIGDDYYAEKQNDTSDITIKPDSELSFIDNYYDVVSASVVNVSSNMNGRTLMVYLDGNYYGDMTVDNNKSQIDFGVLTAGNHTVTVKFEGDESFTRIYESHVIFVEKLNSSVNVTATSVRTGNPVFVEVNASGKGIATVVIFNDTNILGTYNITINNGVGSFIVPVDFVEGKYDLNITYDGDDIYYASKNGTSFTVTDRSLSKIKFSEPDLYFVNSTNTIDIITNFPTGTLNVLLDGKKVNSISVDNYNAKLDLVDLSAGNHNILISYGGDYDYTDVSNNLTISVIKYDSLLDVDINSPLYVDDMVIITVTVNETAGGYVSVNVNNKDYHLKINNHVAHLNLTGLAYGGYTVSVNYLGDDYYNTNFTSKDFTINRYVSNIVVTDITRGNDLQINLTGFDGYSPVEVTGKLNITIGSITLIDLSVVEGKVIIPADKLPELPDSYSAVLNYSGNYKFLPGGLTTVITINKLPVPTIVPVLNVTIDDDLNITIVGDGRFAVDGNVSVKIDDGESFVLPVVDGVFTIPYDKLPQVESQYDISVSYANGTYYENTSAEWLLHSDKITDYKFTISNDTIRFEENATLIIVLPDDVNATLTIKIDGVDKTVNIIDGRGTLENIGGLHAGLNTVNSEFVSDKYETRAATSTIMVDPNDITLTIAVPVEQLYIDESALVTVRANVSMNNNVTVYVNGKAQSLKLNDGVGSFIISPLVYGEYVFTAVFEGNENYTYTTASEKVFFVKKNNITLNITTSDVVVGHDVKIRVGINDDATGLVIVKVDNAEYSLNVGNKEYSLTVSGLGNGTHSIVAKYYGDSKYYGGENTTSVNISKLNPSIAVSSNILIGEDFIISISNSSSLVGNPTGKLTFTIEGKSVEVNVLNGVATVNAVDLPQVDDTYTATVEYSGDDNYYGLTESVTFTIDKVPRLVITVPGNVTIDDELVISVGDDTTDGKLNVTIGSGEKFTVNVVDGTAVIPVKYLPQSSNIYAISLDYYGGSYWNDTSVVRSFHADKISVYPFIISNDTIKFDGVAALRFTLPGDVNTTLSVVIDDIVKTVRIANGNGFLSVADLHAGVNPVSASFGSDKYETTISNGYVRVIANEITLNITVPSEQLYVDQSATVVVQANVTMNNTVIVYVNGEPMNLKLTEGKANFTIAPLVYGKYVFTAIFEGNENYTRANANMKSFNVDKIIPSFTVSVDDILVDEDALILVSGLPTDAKGSVLININGTVYSINIVGGKGNLTVSGLKYGNYIVVANFTGDDKYYSNITATGFNVAKNAIGEIKVTSETIKNNKTHVTVTVGKLDAAGEVIITTPTGKFIGKFLDGKTVIEVTGLVDVETPFNVTYVGDAKYLPNSTNGVIVGRGIFIESFVNVTAEDIMVDGKTTIRVSVLDDATGFAMITLDGKSIQLPLRDARAEYSIGGFAYGEHEVTVVYLGDDKYYNSTNSTVFNVKRYNSTTSVEVADGVAGNPVSVKVIVGEFGAGGIVNLKVTKSGIVVGDYNVTLTDGVGVLNITLNDAADYMVDATYLGDNYYDVSSNNTSFNLVYANLTVPVSALNITVGDSAVISVILPADATGNVSLKLNDKNYESIVIEDGKAQFIIPDLGVGNYNAFVTYGGDGKYNSNSNATVFTVSKKDVSPANGNKTNVEVTHLENGTTVLNITVPDNATGNVTVNVNGENITVPIVNGSAIIKLDNVGNDTNITVSYSGDENHTGFSEKTVIGEDGAKFNSNIVISCGDIDVGDSASVTVTVADDATGDLTINIGGKNYTNAIVGGQAVFSVDNLSNGTYVVTAYYNGDKKYLKSTNDTIINVNRVKSAVNVTADDINVGESANIVVSVPADASGIVKLTIMGKVYESPVNDGQAVFNIADLAQGNYTFTAEFAGDSKYLSSSSEGKFTVSKNNINPVGGNDTNVEVDHLDNGTTVIKVNVPDDASGNVTVTVNGENITVPVVNGTAVISLDNIKNSTNVSVSYSGDDKYDGFNQTGVISDDGFKLNAPITVDSDKDSYVAGETAVITIIVPVDATGNVTVNVNGAVSTVPVKDGRAVLEYVVPSSGEFNVSAVYNGGDKYASSENNTSFSAVRADSTIVISVVDTAYDKNATVKVILPSDAAGNVTITVDNVNYTSVVNDGVAVFTLPVLERGDYPVSAVYSGDDKYNANINQTRFNVINRDVELDIKADGIVYGEVLNVTVGVPDGATGYVSVSIGDYTGVAFVENGTVHLIVPNLEPGVHNMTVYYSGDGEYQEYSTNVNVSVARKSSSTGVSVDDISEGETVVITVVVPVDATGDVVITIAGKNYTGTVSECRAVISVAGLSPGNYTVDAVYLGDRYYNGSGNSSVSFLVKANVTIFTNITARGYNSGMDYEARFIDSLGNPLSNRDVVISVGGVDYTVKTDSEGVARLNVKLPVGTHTVSMVNPLTGEETHSNLTISARLIENKNIVTDYNSGYLYKVRVIGDDGSPVGAGVKFTVPINGKKYTYVTDKDGYITIKIDKRFKASVSNKNLVYKLTLSYKGYTIHNTITIKQVLKTKKVVKVKKSAKKLVLKATLKWSNKKPIKGKVVKFKFKGKTYKAKTNKKGVAKVVIKKKVIKKLKLGKNYKVKVTYLTDTVKSWVKYRK